MNKFGTISYCDILKDITIYRSWNIVWRRFLCKAKFQGNQRGRSHVNWWTWLKFIQVPKKNCLFSFSFFTIDFKISLYPRCFDTSHWPPDIFWLHFANPPKLWENELNAECLGKSLKTLCLPNERYQRCIVYCIKKFSNVFCLWREIPCYAVNLTTGL